MQKAEELVKDLHNIMSFEERFTSGSQLSTTLDRLLEPPLTYIPRCVTCSSPRLGCATTVNTKPNRFTDIEAKEKNCTRNFKRRGILYCIKEDRDDNGFGVMV